MNETEMTEQKLAGLTDEDNRLKRKYEHASPAEQVGLIQRMIAIREERIPLYGQLTKTYMPSVMQAKQEEDQGAIETARLWLRVETARASALAAGRELSTPETILWVGAQPEPVPNGPLTAPLHEWRKP